MFCSGKIKRAPDEGMAKACINRKIISIEKLVSLSGRRQRKSEFLGKDNHQKSPLILGGTW
jgi:hypothetical protein